MIGRWIIRYTDCLGAVKVTALLVDVDPDGWPVYQILKVELR